jgi:hypothetical protein
VAVAVSVAIDVLDEDRMVFVVSMLEDMMGGDGTRSGLGSWVTLKLIPSNSQQGPPVQSGVAGNSPTETTLPTCMECMSRLGRSVRSR